MKLPKAGSSINRDKAAFIILIVLVGGFLIQSAVGWMTSFRNALHVQVAAAEPGVVENTVTVEGLVLREELVIFSPKYGEITYLFPEGERVSAGEVIAEISPGAGEEVGGSSEGLFLQRSLSTKNLARLPAEDYPAGKQAGAKEITAPQAGLVSYCIDGMENLGYEGNFKYLKREEFQELDVSPRRVYLGDKIEGGSPLLKIVNNYHWFFSAVVPHDVGEKISHLPKAALYFDFAGSNKVKIVLVEEKTDSSGNFLFTWRIDRDIPFFSRERWTSAEIVYEEHQGCVVPREALVTRGKETVLFTVEDGRVSCYQVALKELDDDKAVVEGVPAYSRVITTPDMVSEGEIIR